MTRPPRNPYERVGRSHVIGQAGWYNTRRHHSTLDYLKPVAHEATACAQALKVA